MRSVLLSGSEDVTCVDVAAPDPGPGEVVIRTRVSAICGSELKGYRDAGAATGNSGHEAAGVGERLGPGGTSLREGERVGVSAVVGCGDCCFELLPQHFGADGGQGGWGDRPTPYSGIAPPIRCPVHTASAALPDAKCFLPLMEPPHPKPHVPRSRARAPAGRGWWAGGRGQLVGQVRTLL